MTGRKLWTVGAAALLLGGCMVDPKEVDSLREQVRLQQKQLIEVKARQEEQTLRADTLNNGFKILSDKAEDNARRIDDLEERAAAGGGQAPRAGGAASAPGPAPEVAPAPAAAPAPVAAPAVPPVPPVEEPPLLLTNRPKGARAAVEPAEGGEIITAGPKAEKLYASALSLFSGRDYEQAARRFAEFVATYPDHKLVGNAQYWIGECSYSQKKFAEAVEEFAKVEKLYPNSPKVPAALLKKGLSLWELKKAPEAQAALERIVNRFPQSEEAAKAKEKLARWKAQ